MYFYISIFIYSIVEGSLILFKRTPFEQHSVIWRGSSVLRDMSQNSSFSVDKINFYCRGIDPSSPQTPQTVKLSQAYSVDEYNYNVESTNEGNVNQATIGVVGNAQTDILELNEVTNVCAEDIQLSSPMHFRRVPCRMRRDRFDLVTTERQLSLDVSKSCCACWCMPSLVMSKTLI